MAEKQESLDLMLREVDAQREGDLRHFESLDSQAAVVIGFAGVLVALASPPGLAVSIARSLAAIAALVALAAFTVRYYGVINVAALREHHLAADVRFTKLYLLDSKVALEALTAESLRRKALRVKVAMSLLAVAILTLASDMVLQGGVA